MKGAASKLRQSQNWTPIDRAHLDLRSRRSAIRRTGAPGCALLRLARPAAGASHTHLQSFFGILQANAYSGYNELYDASRAQGTVTPALCWAHARRQFFELADVAANSRRDKNAAAISPIALEAVKRIDALFDIERGIKRRTASTGAQRAKRTLAGGAGSVAARAACSAIELLIGRQANQLHAAPLGSVHSLHR